MSLLSKIYASTSKPKFCLLSAEPLLTPALHVALEFLGKTVVNLPIVIERHSYLNNDSHHLEGTIST